MPLTPEEIQAQLQALQGAQGQMATQLAVSSQMMGRLESSVNQLVAALNSDTGFPARLGELKGKQALLEERHAHLVKAIWTCAGVAGAALVCAIPNVVQVILFFAAGSGVKH